MLRRAAPSFGLLAFRFRIGGMLAQPTDPNPAKSLAIRGNKASSCV